MENEGTLNGGSKKDEELVCDSMDELIVCAGTAGWRNFLIYFFCAWSTFITPFHALSYQFLGATPGYWCGVEVLENENWTQQEIISLSVPSTSFNSEGLASCKYYDFNYTLAMEIGYNESMKDSEHFLRNNDTSTLTCARRLFNSSEPVTVVSMWDLVCDRRTIYSTTQSAVFGGIFIGSFFVGYFLDLLGRRTVFLLSIPLYLTAGISAAFSPNVQVYIFFKFLIAVIGSVYLFVGLILTFEMCDANQRTYLGSLNGLPWAFGYMALPGVAYYIRTFKYLQIAVTLPGLTIIPIYWVIPESPRWLVSKNRLNDALAVLHKIAKCNHRKMPSDDKAIEIMRTTFEKQKLSKKQPKNKLVILHKIYGLWLKKEWTWKLLILCFTWFATSMVYYGLSLNPPNLSKGKYMYMFLGGAIEIPSYLLIWILGKYFGRKNPMIVLYIIYAFAIYGAMAISLMSYAGASKYGWLLFLSLVAKGAITTAFQVIWMYTIEVLPTDYRSVVVGEASVCARIGSIFSPYIVDLLGESHKWAPFAIFGSMSMAAGLLFCLMPETSKKPLLETSQDTEPAEVSKEQ